MVQQTISVLLVLLLVSSPHKLEAELPVNAAVDNTLKLSHLPLLVLLVQLTARNVLRMLKAP